MTRYRILMGCTVSILAIACGHKLGWPVGGGGTANPGDSGVDWISSGDADGGASDSGSSPIDTGSGDTGSGDTDTDTDTDTDPEDTGIVIEGTGYAEGDVAYNLTAQDQTSTPWALHDQYGAVVVLLVGNLYDGRTIETLTSMNEVAADGDHTGVRWVALIGYSETSAPCDVACAAAAASTYGISTVLWDGSAGMATHTEWIQGDAARLYIIDEEMVIRTVNPGATTSSLLDNELDDVTR